MHFDTPSRFLNAEPYVSGSENVGFSVGKRRKYKGILQNGQKCSMFHVRKHVPFISESY